MQLAITYRAVTDLKPYSRNARTDSRKQLKQIAAAIKEFGFTNPVLIDESDQIIAGHGRVAAAKLLGLAEVPTLQLSHLNPLQKRAYIGDIPLMRVNAIHHTIALVRAPQAGIQHITRSRGMLFPKIPTA